MTSMLADNHRFFFGGGGGCVTVILRIRLVLIELFKNYKVYRKIGREKKVTKDTIYQPVLPGKLVVLHSSIFVTELLVKMCVKVTKYVRRALRMSCQTTCSRSLQYGQHNEKV